MSEGWQSRKFSGKSTHNCQQLFQVTAVCLTLGSNSCLWLSKYSCQFCPCWFLFCLNTSNLYYMNYQIRAMICMKQFPRCSEIGFEINIYVFVFDCNMWFSICIFSILHLYKIEFGAACSIFLKAIPTISNLLISDAFNFDKKNSWQNYYGGDWNTPDLSNLEKTHPIGLKRAW